MKRIYAIVKAKDKISEIFDRKAKRILRGIDSAIACAKDCADEAKEAASDIIDSLGEVSSKDDTAVLQTRLNDYAKKREEADRWEQYAQYFEELKNKLNEEVEIE